MVLNQLSLIFTEKKIRISLLNKNSEGAINLQLMLIT